MAEDEPTASLDARAEFEVFQRFAELTRGRMAVLISHRFSTVRMLDRILVLENAAIVEQGSHHEGLAGGRVSLTMSLERDGYAIIPRVFAPAAIDNLILLTPDLAGSGRGSPNGGLVRQIYYSKPLCVIV